MVLKFASHIFTVFLYQLLSFCNILQILFKPGIPFITVCSELIKLGRTASYPVDPKYGDAVWGDFELVDELSKLANVEVPEAVEEIRSASVRHTAICEKDGMKDVVRDFLKL